MIECVRGRNQDAGTRKRPHVPEALALSKYDELTPGMKLTATFACKAGHILEHGVISTPLFVVWRNRQVSHHGLCDLAVHSVRAMCSPHWHWSRRLRSAGLNRNVRSAFYPCHGINRAKASIEPKLKARRGPPTRRRHVRRRAHPNTLVSRFPSCLHIG